MALINQVVDALVKVKTPYLSFDQIFKLVGPLYKFNKKAVLTALNSLITDGKLLFTERGKYVLAERSGFIRGEVMGGRKGFVFIRPDGEKDEDIFIQERYTGGAVNGDIVLVKVFNRFDRGRSFAGRTGDKNRRASDNNRKAGEIVKILKRKPFNIVGVFKMAPSGGMVVPDDTRFAEDIFIASSDSLGAKTNEKVVVKILDYPSRTTMARGEIVEILGDVNDIGIDTLSVIRSFNLYEEFPEKVEEEAMLLATEPQEKDFVKRKDIRNLFTITIDGEDARDFDDAITLTKEKDGTYYLGVHIADVAAYVKENGQIDKEALKRGTSVYFPDMVLPMLPRSLSNNICSLNPDVNRLTQSVFMRIDENGGVKDYEICESVIKSNNRMTYTTVLKIIEGDAEACRKYKPLVPMIKDMEELAKIMIKRRDKMGNIDFNLPEVQIIMDDKNQIKEIKRKPITMADRIIEQFMLIANEIVAKHMFLMGIPFVYRVHEIPTPERMKEFKEFLRGLDIDTKFGIDDVKPREMQAILKSIKGEPYETLISKVMLRSMQKARYYEENLGHFGIACEHYCHFTAPIRRYPDLIIHRIIKEMLNGVLSESRIRHYENIVPDVALSSSERERIADSAERAVDDLKKAEYMAKHIGEEFEGIVNGLTPNGIYVELDNTAEGFITTDDFKDKSLVFNEKRYGFESDRSSIRLGDQVKIRVESVDIPTRKVFFTFA